MKSLDEIANDWGGAAPTLELPPTADEIDYPSEDGEPMAETGFHANSMVLLKQALEDLLATRDVNAHIAMDMYWYWEEGNVKARVAPDLMVIYGAGPRIRDSFMSWKEDGRIPNIIFEMASKNNWREDINTKRVLYERLGVQEYFIFDPKEEYLRPNLWGFRLLNGIYGRQFDEGEGLISDVLQAHLKPDGFMLRLTDLVTNLPILSREEQVLLERQKRIEELQRIELLVAEVERLRETIKQSGLPNGASDQGS